MTYHVILEMTPVIDEGFDHLPTFGANIKVYENKSDAEDNMLSFQQNNKHKKYFLFKAISRTNPTGVFKGGKSIFRIDEV